MAENLPSESSNYKQNAYARSTHKARAQSTDEQCGKKTKIFSYVNCKDSDKPAHQHSLVRFFPVSQLQWTLVISNSSTLINWGNLQSAQDFFVYLENHYLIKCYANL